MTTILPVATCLLCMSLAMSGCGGADSYSDVADDAASSTDAELGSMDEGNNASAAGVNETKPVDPAKIKSQDFKRRIVRTGEMELYVEQFSQVPAKIGELVDQYAGYIASSDVTGSTGDARTGRWTLRVPSDRFEEFLDEVEHLGELQSRHTNSREVTTEYYDVSSRISNQQAEEARLLKHLDENTGGLNDILMIERELTRVRGQLELLQGRLRMLEDVTSLSTMTLTVNEILAFTPAEAPGFGTRVSRTFETTKGNLISLGQTLVILFVGFGPWLVVFSLPLTIAFLVGRRIYRGTMTSISNP